MRLAAGLVLVVLCACGDSSSTPPTFDARPAFDAAVSFDSAVPDAPPPDAAPVTMNLCDPMGLPMNRAAPTACCRVGNDEWFVAGFDPFNLAHRKHATPCTLEDGVTGGCTGMQCLHGPCGARQLEFFATPGHVFVPKSDPTVCGRQGTGLPGFPEAWTESHQSYPPVTPACPFTGCSATGPTVSLMVTTAAATATGRVTSTPAGIDVTGAGNGTAAFGTTAITLQAAPVGMYARAVFSGGCSATGAYGQPATCQVTLGPDKAVAVTFECDPYYTCTP